MSPNTTHTHSFFNKQHTTAESHRHCRHRKSSHSVSLFRVRVTHRIETHFTLSHPLSLSHRCSNCGKHTDPYYEPKHSSTNKVLDCAQCQGGAHCAPNKKCEFSQSYTEGSSWKAFQMQDVIWVGDLRIESQPVATTGPKLSVPFLFGCQYSETGLFRTQKADGIMGLSINSLTLVPTMARQGLIPFKTFSLCFSRTGTHSIYLCAVFAIMFFYPYTPLSLTHRFSLSFFYVSPSLFNRRHDDAGWC